MRTIARRIALPAAALSAALTLTACGSGVGTAPAPAAASVRPTTVAPATGTATPPSPTEAPGKAPAQAPSKAPARASTAPTTAPPAKPAGTASSSRPSACTAATTKVVASKVSRPINHLALIVTNTGSRPCDALNAPFVGFENSQATVRILEDSKPQAVVTLSPGESAYASLILTGEPGPDTHGRTVRTIRVYLTSDSGKTVTAPSGTYADDGAAVSYWQRTLEDALMY